MVDEGMGYAISFDKLINVSGNSNLCFRPLEPKLEENYKNQYIEMTDEKESKAYPLNLPLLLFLFVQGQNHAS